MVKNFNFRVSYISLCFRDVYEVVIIIFSTLLHSHFIIQGVENILPYYYPLFIGVLEWFFSSFEKLNTFFVRGEKDLDLSDDSCPKAIGISTKNKNKT